MTISSFAAAKKRRTPPPTLFAGSVRADDTIVMSSASPSLQAALAAAADENIFDTLVPVRESRRKLMLVAENNVTPMPANDSVSESGERSALHSMVVPAALSNESGPQPEASVSPTPSPVEPAAPQQGVVSQKVGGAFVKAYRVVGFVILAAILGGLAIYIGTHLFFMANRSWAAPSILTPADPKVLGFASRFVEESARRDALLVQRADVETRRREAARMVAIEKTFQQAYNVAMQADLADRKAELGRARGMLGAYATARKSVASASDAFKSSSEDRLKQEFAAGVIDKDHMLNGNLQLAQIADARLSLDARSVEMQGRVATLSRMVDALDTTANHNGIASSYETLKIRAEYDRSVAAAARAQDELEATTKSVARLDETIRAEEGILETMKRSAYHGITSQSGKAVFAFVPYDNASSVKEGAPVYACRAGVVWCRKVGQLGKAAEGEVVQKHPLLHQDLRGMFVRMEIADSSAAESSVLHLGRAPLFL
jgi:hypothetical protein